MDYFQGVVTEYLRADRSTFVNTEYLIQVDTLTRGIENRKARQEFIARGLASAAQAKKTGKHVSAEKVVAKLERKLVKAKQRAA